MATYTGADNDDTLTGGIGNDTFRFVTQGEGVDTFAGLKSFTVTKISIVAG